MFKTSKRSQRGHADLGMVMFMVWLCVFLLLSVVFPPMAAIILLAAVIYMIWGFMSV